MLLRKLSSSTSLRGSKASWLRRDQDALSGGGSRSRRQIESVVHGGGEVHESSTVRRQVVYRGMGGQVSPPGGKGRGVRSLTETSIVGSSKWRRGKLRASARQKDECTVGYQRPKQAAKSDTVEVDAAEKQRGDEMRFICCEAVARAKAAMSALRGVFRAPCRLGG